MGDIVVGIFIGLLLISLVVAVSVPKMDRGSHRHVPNFYSLSRDGVGTQWILACQHQDCGETLVISSSDGTTLGYKEGKMWGRMQGWYVDKKHDYCPHHTDDAKRGEL